MTTKDLQTIKSGDQIRFKPGHRDAGMIARFIRLAPLPVSSVAAQQVTFEHCGRTMTFPHTAFTKVR